MVLSVKSSILVLEAVGSSSVSSLDLFILAEIHISLESFCKLVGLFLAVTRPVS